MTEATPGGRLALVGIGPGDPAHLTARARAAILAADTLIGHSTYLRLLAPLVGAGFGAGGDRQQVLSSGMTAELDRARRAVRLALGGRRVALVSSGDSGVYGMAALTFEVLFQHGWTPASPLAVEVVPGVTALTACAALIGAPLSHDFCAISLSDLLTPWPVIARRLVAAAAADFVIALYNPQSARRAAQLPEAVRLLGLHRLPQTPVAVVSAAWRVGQAACVTTLAGLAEAAVGMQSTVLIGNSQTRVRHGLLVTPRGYADKYDLHSGDLLGGERRGASLRGGLAGWLATIGASTDDDDALAARFGLPAAYVAMARAPTAHRAPAGSVRAAITPAGGPDLASDTLAPNLVPEPKPEPEPEPQPDPAPDRARATRPARACAALFIGAPASGQGKTTVTAGLAWLHRRAGRRVRVFKTGPDFLDPMILAHASGGPVYNLDLWMGGAAHCAALLRQAADEVDLILVEGAMGLHDGEPSGAELAIRLGLPVVCVIDAAAMAQTFAALAFGLARFRPGLTCVGVLANRVGGAGHVALVREGLGAVGVDDRGGAGDGSAEGAAAQAGAGSGAGAGRFLGALPRAADLELPHRHLGLWQAVEVADLDARLTRIADALAATTLARLPAPVAFGGAPAAPDTPPAAGKRDLHGVRIAVARDLAFAFLYQANLDLLGAAGAALRFFSPLADDRLPDCDALYLPGGYPELHLERLAANTGMLAAVRAHHTAGRPLLAECGGLLYLLDSLAPVAGPPTPLVGLLPGQARMQSRLVNLGLHRVVLPEGELRGHTFHHSRAEVALTPLTHSLPGRHHGSAEAVYRTARLTATYLHLYFPSNPTAAVALLCP